MAKDIWNLREHRHQCSIKNATEEARNRAVCSFFVNAGREDLFAAAARIRSYTPPFHDVCYKDPNAADYQKSVSNEMPTRAEFTLVAWDCVQGMRTLSAESIDLVVTSPPYNCGTDYRTYDDRRGFDEYWHWTLEWAAEVKRILKLEGSFFLNVGALPSNRLFPHEMILRLSSLFEVQNTFHWVKSISIAKGQDKILSMGHFKPINSIRFVNDLQEFVFHLTKAGMTPLDRLAVGVPYAEKSNINRWNHARARDLRCRGNVWFIPYKTIRDRRRDRPHPATFPEELAMNCIKIHGTKREIVMLDPFLGIGQSAIAAKKCGVRKFIGFDIDPDYVEAARIRVERNP